MCRLGIIISDPYRELASSRVAFPSCSERKEKKKRYENHKTCTSHRLRNRLIMSAPTNTRESVFDGKLKLLPQAIN